MQIGEGVAVGIISDEPEPSKDKKRIKIRVSLFFDGTGNNRENTGAREQNAQANRDFGAGDSSYANDFSNVARLEANVEDKAAGYDEYIAVYTEGIGTNNLGADSRIGFALGTGTTGVESKVDRGIRFALALLSKLDYPGTVPSSRSSR